MSVPVFRLTPSLRVREEEVIGVAQWGDAGTRNKARAPQDVEAALVWAFRDQAVLSARGLHRLEASADGYELHEVSRDGIAAIESIGLVGCRIDTSGGAGHVAPDDALALMQAVLRLDARRRGLLIRHATAGTAPAWDLGRPRALPRYEGRGRKVLVLDGFCPIAWQNARETQEAMRADYRAWWFGLQDVWRDLSVRSVGEGGLSFLLAAPATPPMPWDAVRPAQDEAGCESVRRGAPRALDDATIAAIRLAHARGEGSVRKLAERFGVSKSTISRALPAAVVDLEARRIGEKQRAKMRRR